MDGRTSLGPLNYFENKDAMCSAIKRECDIHADTHYSDLPVLPIKEILSTFRPVHRCGTEVFKSILASGSLQSKRLRDHIDGNPQLALRIQIRKDPLIRELTKSNAKDELPLIEWACAFGVVKLRKANGLNLTKAKRNEKRARERMVDFYGWGGGTESVIAVANTSGTALDSSISAMYRAYTAAGNVNSGGGWLPMMHYSATPLNYLNDLEQWLKGIHRNVEEALAGVDKMQQVVRWLEERITVHTTNIAQNAHTGLRIVKDESLGTHEHVFSILGPHFGTHYGKNYFVLNEKILYHPQCHMSPCAATSFLSENARKFNTWLNQPEFVGLSPVDQFHACKLNAAVLGWRSVMAAALGHAITKWKSDMRLSDVTKEDVVSFYSTIDSHCAIEVHLPSVVPLSYVERVVISTATWTELTDDEKVLLGKFFGDEKILLVGDSNSPDEIMKHCLVGKHETITSWKGFCMDLDCNTNNFVLTDVRPKSSQAADIYFDKVGGAFRLDFYHEDNGYCCISFGFGQPLVKTKSGMGKNVFGMPSFSNCSLPFVSEMKGRHMLDTWTKSNDVRHSQAGWVCSMDGSFFEQWECEDDATVDTESVHFHVRVTGTNVSIQREGKEIYKKQSGQHLWLDMNVVTVTTWAYAVSVNNLKMI